MQEQLISLKTAKLAKEKQFQEYTSYFYTKENGLCSIDTDGEILNIYNDDLTFKDSIWDCNGDFWYNEIEDEEGIYAQTYEPIKYPTPTQSLLQKWLREEHNIFVEVKINERLFKSLHEHSHNIKCLKWRWTNYCNIDDSEFIYESFCSQITYDTYEEALEIGLQEALKLI